MSEFIAIIRDDTGRGVRADRVDGWEPGHYGKTRVSLSGGGVIYLEIPPAEFVQRLDRALTTHRDTNPDPTRKES